MYKIHQLLEYRPNSRDAFSDVPQIVGTSNPIRSSTPTHFKGPNELGTVLGPLLFLIMIIDIDNGISPSSNPDIIPTLVQCWFNVVHYNGPWPAYNVGPV